MPRVVLISDPSFPDRTAHVVEGNIRELLTRVSDSLESLCSAGATHLVLCCFTMHCFVPQLPESLRQRIISLVDRLLYEVIARRQPALLICTTGARRLRVFEQSPYWPTAEPLLVLPRPEDQTQIHELLYKMKTGALPDATWPILKGLAAKYGVSALAAGCTEMHLVSPDSESESPVLLDPLAMLARALHQPSGEFTAPLGNPTEAVHA